MASRDASAVPKIALRQGLRSEPTGIGIGRIPEKTSTQGSQGSQGSAKTLRVQEGQPDPAKDFNTGVTGVTGDAPDGAVTAPSDSPVVQLNEITGEIIRAALRVHSALGPGLLESAYRTFLGHELIQNGLHVQSEVAIPVTYNGVAVDVGYRIDLLVEDKVLVELKSVSKLLPVHHAQLLSYLRLSRRPVGLLINFNVSRLRDGIKRIAN